MSSTVLRDDHGGVTTLTLNRPDAFNALDVELLNALHAAALETGREESVRVVVLTGAGRAFCAGGDLKWMRAQDERPSEAVYRLAAIFHQAVLEIRAMGKPVIAAINGAAAGGGFSLACACDLRVMADTAFLKLAYTAGGLSIDGGGTWTLPRLVGWNRAMEIGLIDEKIEPARALEIGLVNRVVPAADLNQEVTDLAAKLSTYAAGSLANAKRLLYASATNPYEAQLEEERRLLAAQLGTSDGLEGLDSFADKRPPKFGRG